MEAINYSAGKLTLLDQTLLPNRVEYRIDNYRDVVKAIKTMQVREHCHWSDSGLCPCFGGFGI